MIPMSEENIFLKIKDPVERKQLFDQIVSLKSDITAKPADSEREAVILTVVGWAAKGQIMSSPASPLSFKKTDNLILQFVVDQDKYLTIAKFEMNSDKVLLNPIGDLFKIQRRDDFRVKLSKSYAAKLSIIKINTKSMSTKFIVTDLSAGGCQIELNTSDIHMKSMDHLEGEITLHKRNPIKVIAEVRHIAAHPTDSRKQIIGLQFLYLEEIEKNRLVSIVLDLYKELFAKFRD